MLARLLPTLVLALTLTACGGADEPAKPSGPEPVGLWSVCTDHARGQVSGSWRFPYSADVAVEKDGTSYAVNGPVRGPGDQTFTLSCSLTDVTDDSATVASYDLE